MKHARNQRDKAVFNEYHRRKETYIIRRDKYVNRSNPINSKLVKRSK